METPDAIAKLMNAFRRGDPAAGGALASALYPELRRLAAAKMKGERSAHTWQPTGSDDDRAAFLGLAGHMMKRLLIHHARPLYRRAEQVEISEDAEAADTKAESLQEVEDALAGLAAIDHRLRTVVEMKVFEGLTGDEIARQLGCSRGTVNNWWRFAQSWLQEEWAPGRRG